MNAKAVDLNLLSTYHPKRNFYHESALAQAIKFVVLALVWSVIVFAAASAAGLTFAWLKPLLIEKFAPSMFSFITPEIAAQIADLHAFIAPTVVIATVIPVNALFMVLCERKFLALLTVRMGPTDVGPNGFLQTLADALKLLFKEDTTPTKSDKLLFFLAPALFFTPAMIVFLPLLSVAANNLGYFSATDLDVGVIFIIGFASLGTMSLVMEGWASNNKYSLMGGLRAASQAISYEIPMVLTLIAIILMTGSMNLVTISDGQTGGLLNWNIFGQGQLLNVTQMFANHPGDFSTGFYSAAFVLLCMTLFLVYVIAATAEVNRIPFDIPEAESELVSGFNTECSGMKFALFFLAEYTNLFITSGVAVILFLGGSHLPISAAAETALMSSLTDLSVTIPYLGELTGLNLTWVVTGFTLLIKIYLMFLVAIWIRATLPRLRQDQLMEFGWKYLIPLSLGLIFLTTILLELLKL